MKAHELKTPLFWERQKQKQLDLRISPTDYEEWRANPVTLALYDDLESAVIQAQVEASESEDPDPHVTNAAQKCLLGMSKALQKVFEWVPEGLELEADE